MLAIDGEEGRASLARCSYHQIGSPHQLHHAWPLIGSSWLWPWTWFNHNAVSVVKAGCVHIDVYPDTTRLLRRCCHTEWTGPTWGRQICGYGQSTLVATNAENCSYPLGTYW